MFSDAVMKRLCRDNRNGEREYSFGCDKEYPGSVINVKRARFGINITDRKYVMFFDCLSAKS